MKYLFSSLWWSFHLGAFAEKKRVMGDVIGGQRPRLDVVHLLVFFWDSGAEPTPFFFNPRPYCIIASLI